MVSLIYIAPLFLYFPRFLPGVETQPLLSIGLALLALLWVRKRRALLGYVGLLWALFFWIAVKTLAEGEPGDAIGLVQLLIAPLTLFGALALNAPPPSRKVIAWVSLYYVLCAAFEILATDTYQVVASSLLSRATVTDGHRGISLFTPEPTYATISVSYFLVLAWWSGRHYGFRYRWIEPALAGCLILTGSMYVALLLLTFAFVRLPRLMILTTMVVGASVQLVDYIALGNDDSIRAVVAVSRLLASDFSDFLPSISVIDSSLGSRLTTNAASLLTPLHTPMGLGLSCESVPKAFLAAGFDFAFSNAVLSSVIEEGCLKPQSYAAAVALGLGAIAPVFIVLICALAHFARRRAKMRAVWPEPLALAVVMLIVQGQLTSPIPWLLIFFALRGLPEHSKAHRRVLPVNTALNSST